MNGMIFLGIFLFGLRQIIFLIGIIFEVVSYFEIEKQKFSGFVLFIFYWLRSSRFLLGR